MTAKLALASGRCTFALTTPATPLSRKVYAHQGGFFLSIRVHFSKPVLPIADQVALLRNRGLTIPNTAEAEQALTRFGYYRLAAYFLPLQLPDEPGHVFRPGTTLAQVLALYGFDDALRLLVFKAAGTVEVVLRTQLIYQGGLAFGAHWYADPAAAFDATRFRDNLAQLEADMDRASERFLAHYRRTYTSPPLPPCWMALEIASFGTVSKLLNNLRSPASKAIGRFFGVDVRVLTSWARSICYVRNVCAHHSRLWNRVLTVKPTLPTHTARPWLTNRAIADNHLYAVLCCLSYLLEAVDDAADFRQQVRDLFARYPTVNPGALGFPAGWERERLWL